MKYLIRRSFIAINKIRPPPYLINGDIYAGKVASWKWTGPRLNIKTVLSTYGDFKVKDKTAARTSYL